MRTLMEQEQFQKINQNIKKKKQKKKKKKKKKRNINSNTTVDRCAWSFQRYTKSMSTYRRYY